MKADSDQPDVTRIVSQVMITGIRIDQAVKWTSRECVCSSQVLPIEAQYISL